MRLDRPLRSSLALVLAALVMSGPGAPGGGEAAPQPQDEQAQQPQFFYPELSPFGVVVGSIDGDSDSELPHVPYTLMRPSAPPAADRVSLESPLASSIPGGPELESVCSWSEQAVAQSSRSTEAQGATEIPGSRCGIHICDLCPSLAVPSVPDRVYAYCDPPHSTVTRHGPVGASTSSTPPRSPRPLRSPSSAPPSPRHWPPGWRSGRDGGR